MDFLAGIKGSDFVMVCSDTSAVHSIVTMKQVRS
jgi:20S proteasome subunit beta 4